MEMGYIFFNKTIQKYCIQEMSLEPDEQIYAHIIKPYEIMHVVVKSHIEKITGINRIFDSAEKWSYLEGLQVYYEKKSIEVLQNGKY